MNSPYTILNILHSPAFCSAMCLRHMFEVLYDFMFDVVMYIDMPTLPVDVSIIL